MKNSDRPHNKLLKFTHDNIAQARRMMEESERMLAEINLPTDQQEAIDKVVEGIKARKIGVQEAIEQVQKIMNNARTNES